jgi:hypothetical protein
MDQFTRRLVGFGAHCGVVTTPTSAVQRRHSPAGRTTTSQHRSRSAVPSAPVDGELADSGDRRNQNPANVPLSHPSWALDWNDAARILDQVLFWNARDLERKLAEFRCISQCGTLPRVIEGHTPMTFDSGHTVPPADLHNVRWVSHCRDLVQLPVAA